MGEYNGIARARGGDYRGIGVTFIAWFEELPPQSTAVAGGKGASLGNMAQAGLPVPPGFIICAEGFRVFLETIGGEHVIQRAMAGLDVHTEKHLNRAAMSVRELVLSNPLPELLENAIRSACAALGDDASVAVRSSAVSEDGDTASFAGQQETFLNVRGADNIVRHVQQCWASFFTPRAIFYRAQKGSLQDSAMAVVVQRMVRAKKSGVMFTNDPVQKRRDHIMIEAVFGLGEAVVSGMVTPDHYVLNRSDGALVREFIAFQPIALVYDEHDNGTRELELSEAQGSARVLTDGEIRSLLDLGLKLEAHFGKPQDIEWSIENDDIYLLQSRPITTL
jgi:pyruvate,water dikinase